ncbi:sigma-70 family RNA polymerase sigma factor [Sorangium sp. So ce367]|uniref:RNA polymerase sigma factor n=1 Tax=Sorangium sp. So ce367 TaxID=3133305 RepID=UPI003F61A0BD
MASGSRSALPHPAGRAGAAPSGGQLVALPVERDDAELLRRLKRGDPWAKAMLFERYGALVERIARRILGTERHTTFADVVHDAFVSAYSSVHQVSDAAALTSWVRSVAVHTACKSIRQRKARSWLSFLSPEDLPELPARGADAELREAHDRTYRLLESFPLDERVAFALRYIEGMELTEAAAASGVSLATIKRRIARAEARFVSAARRDPVLAAWIEEGARWTP